MYGASTGMAWPMLFGLLIWLGLVGAGIWAVARYVRRPPTTRPARQRPPRETPLEILERRYAEGEIDAETFDEARARIREL